jgi:AcrR family transcriptional regulator
VKLDIDATGPIARPSRAGRSGGRPTAAEARRRQQYLLEVAGAMFMKNGFDGTSIDAVADAAGMSKRTLYARYGDKGALFRAVLSDLIARWLVPIARFQANTIALEPMLMEIGKYLVTSALAPQAVSVHRIIVGEAERRPEFAQLAHAEGRQAAVRAIAAALKRHQDELRVEDLMQTAELFLSLVIDGSLRLAVLGIPFTKSDLDRRLRAAVDLFLNGVRRR